MRICRTVLAVALATLWVAVGLHCRLEVLPGFEFLSCCQHGVSDEASGHHDGDCDRDGCAAVELGLYKVSKPQQAPLKPVLALATWLAPLAADDQPAPDLSLDRASSLPLEISRIWRFSQRAALPPRAPSFVS